MLIKLNALKVSAKNGTDYYLHSVSGTVLALRPRGMATPSVVESDDVIPVFGENFPCQEVETAIQVDFRGFGESRGERDLSRAAYLMLMGRGISDWYRLKVIERGGHFTSAEAVQLLRDEGVIDTDYAAELCAGLVSHLHYMENVDGGKSAYSRD